eukprot:5517247-Pyramimonas_sp.AAC.1
MRKRAVAWKDIGAGMLVSIAALRIYIFPLAGFLLRLEALPEHWAQTERKLLETLFPGARGWACPCLLQHLKGLGFPAEVPNLRATAQGAKCRVYRWENAAQGGLQFDGRQRRLIQARMNSDFMGRVGTRRD